MKQAVHDCACLFTAEHPGLLVFSMFCPKNGTFCPAGSVDSEGRKTLFKGRRLAMVSLLCFGSLRLGVSGLDGLEMDLLGNGCVPGVGVLAFIGSSARHFVERL